MNNWRSPGVKEVKALQNLPTPAPQDFGFHHLEPLKVTVKRQQMMLKSKRTTGDNEKISMRQNNLIYKFQCIMINGYDFMLGL